jgi:hypothetical protein
MHAIGSKAQPAPSEPTMRQERTVQATIFEVFAGHEIGGELKAISQWLDRRRALVSLVARDLRRHVLRKTTTRDRTPRPAGGGRAALCAALHGAEVCATRPPWAHASWPRPARR